MSSLIRLRRLFGGLLFSLLVLTLVVGSASAADCEFALGFKALRDLIGQEIVGECLENENHNDKGDSAQSTTGGLLVWRKADNYTAFTDGHHTWINGPNGLQKRLNAERFSWEADYESGGNVARTPQPATAGVSTSTTPEPVPLPPPESIPPDGALPLPPAPTHATVINAPNADSASAYLIRVTARYAWVSGITSFRITSDLPGLSGSFSRVGANEVSIGSTVTVCTTEQSGQTLNYDVTFSVLGDGVRYQAVWSPEHTVTHTVTCAVSPTPTPDASLPLAPALRASISSRAANRDGKLVEVVVAAERLPNVDLRQLWLDDSPAYSLLAVAGTTDYYHGYICAAEDAGQLQDLRVILISFGDGQTYRQGIGERNLLQLRLTCPQPGVPHVPGPTPTPTLTQDQEGLPLPPQVSASISSRISEVNFNAWRPGSAIVIVEWDYAWPDGVASMQRDTVLHSAYQGTSEFSQSQIQQKATIACDTNDAGKTREYSVKFRTRGDGVKYQPVWGAWGSLASIDVTCPGRSSSLITATVTPTPSPTPPAGTLPLPPPPSLSLSSSSRGLVGQHYTMKVTLGVTLDDGVQAVQLGGNLYTQDWGRLSSSGSSTSYIERNVCTPQEDGQVLNIYVSASAKGDGIKYRKGWGSTGSTVSHSVACPVRPAPTPSPTLVPGTTPTPTSTLTPSPTSTPLAGVLPLPSAPSLSLESRAQNLADDFSMMVIAHTWFDNGVQAIHFSGNLFGAGDRRWRQSTTGGQAANMYKYTCLPNQDGQTLNFTVTAKAQGDGKVYRSKSGPGTTSTISVTCPVRATPTPTPTIVPGTTPTPTPTLVPGQRRHLRRRLRQ